MLKGLTGLRFFLALHVVFFHNLSFFEGTGPLYLFMSKGYCAVSGFFLLSGFVLAYRYKSLNSKQELISYSVARFARIYPLYFLALLIELPLFIFFFYRIYGNEWEAKVLCVFIANIFMVQSWNDNWLSHLNAPGWSLSVEFFFYLVFPLILHFFSKKLNSFSLIAGMVLIYLLIFFEIPAMAITFVYKYIAVPVNTDAHPLVHLPVFVIGCILGFIFKCSNHVSSYLKENKLASLLPLFSILALGLILTSKSIDAYNINNGLLVPVFAAAILGLINQNNFISKILSKDIFQLLGNASFGIYLLQMPIRRWTALFFEKTGLMAICGNQLYLMLYFIFLVVISIWVYANYEKIMNKKIRSLSFSKS